MSSRIIFHWQQHWRQHWSRRLVRSPSLMVKIHEGHNYPQGHWQWNSKEYQGIAETVTHIEMTDERDSKLEEVLYGEDVWLKSDSQQTEVITDRWIYPPPHPWWLCKGYSQGDAIIVAYADSPSKYLITVWLWTSRYSQEDLTEYKFSGRMPRPDWFNVWVRKMPINKLVS